MTRTSHKAHPTPSFPVYCLDWADDETLILGGGGGASRSGIANKIKWAKVSRNGRTVKYVKELALSSEEDAPMTLAVDRERQQLVTGINASSSSVQAGKNQNARLYTYGSDEPKLAQSQQTIDAEWSDDYPYQGSLHEHLEKLTAIDSSATFVAVGSTDNKVSILKLSDMSLAANALVLDKELVDLNFGGSDGSWLAVTTVSEIRIYHILTTEKVSLELKQTIYPPSIDISPVVFRSARFSPLVDGPVVLHAVLNMSKAPAKGQVRKSFVVTFGMIASPTSAPLTEAEKESGTGSGKGKQNVTAQGEELGRWDVLVRREVAKKPITVFDVSANGKLLAYGCSDLSLGIIDAKTLAPLLKILHAHSFPPTALKFNPSANLLVSASADNTIRAVVVPASFTGCTVSLSMVLIFLAILIAVIAFVIRR